MANESKRTSTLSKILGRYFVDAMGAMAYGLFASLIVGVIISQLATFEALSFLSRLSEVLQMSQTYGAVIGVAIAWGLKVDPLVMLSCGGAGAIGCVAGGPVGAFVGAVIGAELGQLVSKRTPLDIVLTPLVVLLSGGLVSVFVGPYVMQFMGWLKMVVENAMILIPLPMGAAVGVIVGMVLTLPISSAALCIMVGLEGLAAGAACAGCCAQMVGFAVISFRDNGVSGLVSQGIGTSMLQVPNIMRRPQIWIAPTVASAVVGALSATVFKMETNSYGAGMGTSGLVGQITTFGVMAPTRGTAATLLSIAVVHFLIPAIVALSVDFLMRKIGWVKSGDMRLQKI